MIMRPFYLIIAKPDAGDLYLHFWGTPSFDMPAPALPTDLGKINIDLCSWRIDIRVLLLEIYNTIGQKAACSTIQRLPRNKEDL